jgi:hypothetical protein
LWTANLELKRTYIVTLLWGFDLFQKHLLHFKRGGEPCNYKGFEALFLDFILFFKGSPTRDSGFFTNRFPPGPLSILFEPFQIFTKIRRDICNFVFIAGVIEDKLFIASVVQWIEIQYASEAAAWVRMPDVKYKIVLFLFIFFLGGGVGGAQRPVLRSNEPEKTGAHAQPKTHKGV